MQHPGTGTSNNRIHICLAATHHTEHLSSLITQYTRTHQGGDVQQIGVSALRYIALFIFVVLSSIQNLVWICFSTILDDAKTYYSINDAQASVYPCHGCERVGHAVGVTAGLAVGISIGCACTRHDFHHLAQKYARALHVAAAVQGS